MRKPCWKLKACPRCGGDLLVEFGEEHCLQCGYIKYVDFTPQPITGLTGIPRRFFELGIDNV